MDIAKSKNQDFCSSSQDLNPGPIKRTSFMGVAVKFYEFSTFDEIETGVQI
jgi:hypothetical protein